jgi:branched-chain amino acid transport system permease protein
MTATSTIVTPMTISCSSPMLMGPRMKRPPRNSSGNCRGSEPHLLVAIFWRMIENPSVLSIGVTIVLVAVIAYIVQRTSMGRALRAVAENRDVARLLGVSGGRITLTAFMMSGALAGAAGVLIAIHYAAITPYIGVEIGLKAIAVMVIGGTSRIWGALLAGPLIGIAEVLTVAYGGSQIRDFVVYGFMIAILLFRPQGLLGGSGADQGQRV